MYLALSESTNDLMLKEGGGLERVDAGRRVVQQVRSALQTILAEYSLKPSVGWLHAADFTKNPDMYGVENRAREIILGTKGVLSIVHMSVSREVRNYLLTFEAKTEFGNIDLEVPWGLGA